MSIVWSQRIKHFDRPVKPTRLRIFRRLGRESARRARSGLPSRSLDAKLVFARITTYLDIRSGKLSQAEASARLAAFALAELRSRLLERKRQRLSTIRARKVTEEKTCINLWRRRRVYLARAESL